MRNELFVTSNDIQRGMNIGLEQLLSPEGEATIIAAAQGVEGGDIQAFYVPAVKLSIDSTLAVVNQPHIEARLSRDVGDRQTTASYIAKHIGTLLARRGALSSFYDIHPTLNKLPVSDYSYESLKDADYIRSLGATPFFDARKVCGGALQLLHKHNVPNPQAAILRSHSLLVVSGIHKQYQLTANRFLGRPYVDQTHLELKDDVDGPRVAFTAAAYQQLQNFMEPGRGCPAGRIAAIENTNVLEQYWQKFVNFLVPADATVEKA